MPKKNSCKIDIFCIDVQNNLKLDAELSAKINNFCYDKIKWPNSGYFSKDKFYPIKCAECTTGYGVSKLTDIIEKEFDNNFLLKSSACKKLIHRHQISKKIISDKLLSIINDYVKNMESS